MSFDNMPDCRVPRSDLRCEAMTQAQPAGMDWQKKIHRCVRKAVTGRDGRSVCAVHNRAKAVVFWDGKTTDAFEHRNPNRRSNV